MSMEVVGTITVQGIRDDDTLLMVAAPVATERLDRTDLAMMQRIASDGELYVGRQGNTQWLRVG